MNIVVFQKNDSRQQKKWNKKNESIGMEEAVWEQKKKKHWAHKTSKLKMTREKNRYTPDTVHNVHKKLVRVSEEELKKTV